MKKRIFSLLFAMLFLVAFSTNGYAVSTEMEVRPMGSSTVIINEYDAMSGLAKQSTDALLTMGYSTTDIKEIQNYKCTYLNHIERLKKYDVVTLKEFGYTETQVNVIKNFKGTETEMTKASASVKLTVSVNLSYNGDYTIGTYRYNWNWSGIPAFKMNDQVAVSWNDWDVTKQGSTVSYYNLNTAKYYAATSATYTDGGNGIEAASHKFSMLYKNENYAKQGTGFFAVQSDVHEKKDMFYFTAYGHGQLALNISFSVSKGGGDASITFSKGVSIVAKASGKVVPK